MSESEILAYFLAIASVVGTAIAVSRNLDNRFNTLRQELHALKQSMGVNETNDLNRLEHFEYRINANTELINHRTERFMAENQRTYVELNHQIQEVKRFLEKTTDFINRARGDG